MFITCLPIWRRQNSSLVKECTIISSANCTIELTPSCKHLSKIRRFSKFAHFKNIFKFHPRTAFFGSFRFFVILNVKSCNVSYLILDLTLYCNWSVKIQVVTQTRHVSSEVWVVVLTFCACYALFAPYACAGLHIKRNLSPFTLLNLRHNKKLFMVSEFIANLLKIY